MTKIPQQPTEFRIEEARSDDVYHDIARIPACYRKDPDGKPIKEGLICCITIRGISRHLILRGDLNASSATIRLDDITRNAFGVQKGDEEEVRMQPAGLINQTRWAWNASDPSYRIASRLGVISLILGAIGLILGLVSLK